MTLTVENNAKLFEPLPLDSGHEVRVAEELQDSKRARWLVYTTEQPVIDRLNEVDPGWSMRHVNTHITSKFAVVSVELTILDVTRMGTGSSDARGSGDTSGDTVKSAATDALKRAARLFGVGSYLLNAPAIYTDWAPKPGKGAKREEWQQVNQIRNAAEKDALHQFGVWYRQQFGGEQKTFTPQPISKPAPEPEASADPTLAQNDTLDDPARRAARRVMTRVWNRHSTNLLMTPVPTLALQGENIGKLVYGFDDEYIAQLGYTSSQHVKDSLGFDSSKEWTDMLGTLLVEIVLAAPNPDGDAMSTKAAAAVTG